MKYMRKKKHIYVAVTIIMLLFGLSMPATVYAAEAEVYFGSNWYEPENGAPFNIGVYLKSEDVIGTYEVVLSYDERYFSYVSGGDSGGDGRITLSGELQGQSLRYMLTFNALAGGESSFKVESAVLYTADGMETMDVLTLSEAPVRIAVSEDNLLTELRINDTEVLDLNSETLTGSVEIPYAEELYVSGGSGLILEPVYDGLTVGENEILLKVTGADEKSNLYTIHVRMSEPAVIEENAPKPEIAEETTSEEDREQGVQSPEPETKQPQIRDKDQRSIVTAVIILTGMLLLFFAYIIRIARQNRKRICQEKLEQLQKIKDANSDFQFCSLYDESEEKEDRTEFKHYE